MANSRNYADSLCGKLNIVGKKIQQYREKQHITKQQLSDKLMILGIDISEKSIYHIERGSRTVVDYEICAIAKVLKIPVQNLLNDYYDTLDEI